MLVARSNNSDDPAVGENSRGKKQGPACGQGKKYNPLWVPAERRLFSFFFLPNFLRLAPMCLDTLHSSLLTERKEKKREEEFYGLAVLEGAECVH
jgi:hypothetical protein